MGFTFNMCIFAQNAFLGIFFLSTDFTFKGMTTKSTKLNAFSDAMQLRGNA